MRVNVQVDTDDGLRIHGRASSQFKRQSEWHKIPHFRFFSYRNVWPKSLVDHWYAVSFTMQLTSISHSMTGTSSGFGRRLVGHVLARGDRVIATARTPSTIEHFPKHPNLHRIELDVNASTEEIKARIDHAAHIWHGIDVLVNNAGSALPALLEEGGYAYQPRCAK